MLWIAATRLAGVYGATFNEGAVTHQDWTALNGGLVGDDLKISGLAVDQRHRNRAYIVTAAKGVANGNLLVNSDLAGGANWTRLTIPAPVSTWADPNLTITWARCCPVYDDTIYLLAGYTRYVYLLRSFDAGATWESFLLAAANYSGHSIAVYPTDGTAAILSLPWLARIGIYSVTNLRSGVPVIAVAVTDGIAVQAALPTPNILAWFRYGEVYTRTWFNTTVWSVYGAFDSLVVTSDQSIRQVTTNLYGTDDGGGTTFVRAAPKSCSSIYGRNGYYVIGKYTSAALAADPVAWATPDDGLSWLPISGGVNRIPWDCGGIPYIGVLGMRGVLPVSGSMPGGVLWDQVHVYNCQMGAPSIKGVFVQGCQMGDPGTGEVRVSNSRLGA